LVAELSIIATRNNFAGVIYMVIINTPATSKMKRTTKENENDYRGRYDCCLGGRTSRLILSKSWRMNIVGWRWLVGVASWMAVAS
jgi:hypothetical protein